MVCLLSFNGAGLGMSRRHRPVFFQDRVQNLNVEILLWWERAAGQHSPNVHRKRCKTGARWKEWFLGKLDDMLIPRHILPFVDTHSPMCDGIYNCHVVGNMLNRAHWLLFQLNRPPPPLLFHLGWGGEAEKIWAPEIPHIFPSNNF